MKRARFGKVIAMILVVAVMACMMVTFASEEVTSMQGTLTRTAQESVATRLRERLSVLRIRETICALTGYK